MKKIYICIVMLAAVLLGTPVGGIKIIDKFI